MAARRAKGSRASDDVVAYALKYASFRGLKPSFPRLVVGMMRELHGWPVRNADGGGNVASFDSVEDAEAAISRARRAYREQFGEGWSSNDRGRDLGTVAAFGLGVASSIVADVIYDRYKEPASRRTILSTVDAGPRRDPSPRKPPVQTVRRTTGRRYPLLLQAASPDAGPYYLVDRAGFGVSWRAPAVEHHPTPNDYPASYAGASFTRRKTWIPVFRRAALAFHLADEDDEVSPKLAKKVADTAYEKLGPRAETGDVVRYAWHLIDKERRKGTR